MLVAGIICEFFPEPWCLEVLKHKLLTIHWLLFFWRLP